MKTVGIKEAKNRFVELAREAERGEKIIVTRNGVPVVELNPYKPKKSGLDFEALRRWKRERGVDRIFGEPAPDFDDPLPEDFLISPEAN